MGPVKPNRKNADCRRRMVRNSMRKLRESIKNDPVRYEEAKKKERERYYARKAAGKIKGVADMTEREKRAIRKKWKDRSKKCYEKKKAEERTETFLEETTPPSSPQQQPIQANTSNTGTRRDAEKNVRKYKKRVQRLKKIKNKKQSPRAYIENLVCGLNVGQEVKKKLLFGEVISTQLKENYKGKRGSIQKRMFIENINGPLIKKYRFTKYISSLSSNNIIYGNRKKGQVMHQKVLQVRRCVKSFLLKDENSRLCPGKRDTVTFRKRKMQKRYLNDSLKNIYECARFGYFSRRYQEQKRVCVYYTQICNLSFLNYITEKTFYEKWITRKQVLEIKGEEKICQRTVKEKILCKKSDIVHTLKQGFHGFLLHLRNIVHQYRIIDDIKKNISTEEILIHADFSENYSCKYNEEVQSAHFGSSKPQITLHTVRHWRDSTKVVVLCVDSKHIEEIDRIVPHDLRAFRGTMKVHEVCWTIETPNILKMRQLSCRLCGEHQDCEHYSLGEIKLLSNEDCREITYDRLRYTDVYSSSDESDDTDDIPLASLRDKMSVYFREGMYVVIKLTGKKIVRHYVGVILRNDGGGEYNIKFMKKTGRKTFVYPERDDIADVDLSDIQIGLQCPDFNDKTNEYVFSDNLDYPNLY
nr:unnamed protein product [Callosobruchus analis]